MHAVPDQLEAIGILAAHESAIADLYEAYSRRFPGRADFFRALAADEREHARVIVQFAEQVLSGAVRVDPQRFSSTSVLASLDRVRGHLQEAVDRTDLPLVRALAVSVDLEDSLIERRYFEIVESDEPELAALLGQLAAETEDHRRKVRHAWEGARAGS